MKFEAIRKYWKEEKRWWRKNEKSFLFLIGLILAIGGMKMFYTGFHNFDSAQNLIFIKDDVTIDLLKEGIDFDVGPYIEQTTQGRYISLEDSYVMGVKQILYSIVLVMIGFFMMGYYFRKMENNVQTR